MAEKAVGGVVAEFWKGAVAAAGALALAWFMGWLVPLWNMATGFFAMGWSHLMASSQWPNWSAYLVSLWLAISALRWAFRAWDRRKDSLSPFNQLIFKGAVLWRWRSMSGLPHNLIPYCLHCDTQLVYQYNDDDPRDGYATHTELVCERCNGSQPRARHRGDYNDLRGHVYREIDRLARTGQWRDHVGGA